MIRLLKLLLLGQWMGSQAFLLENQKMSMNRILRSKTPNLFAVTPEIPEINSIRPVAIRYRFFLDLIEDDRIAKVTFSSDGTRLIATDFEGGNIVAMHCQMI